MITISVTGADRVATRLTSASDALREHVRRSVEQLGIKLQGIVKSDYLTGQSLKVQTGRLRRSINEKTTVDGDEVTSTVGTNLSYARFWELGFSGIEQVKQHTRTTLKGATTVRAHSRQVNQAARPFLQPAIDSMRAEIVRRLVGVGRSAVSGS